MSFYNIVRKIVEENRERSSSRYMRFKRAVLNYYGVQDENELDDPIRKQFFKYIDREWKRYKNTKKSPRGERRIK